MAKTGAKIGKASKVTVGSKRKRSIHFDLLEKELKGLGLNDEVTLTLTAKVKSISAPYEYELEEAKDVKRDPYGDVRLEVNDYKFTSGENEFSKLARTEDEED